MTVTTGQRHTAREYKSRMCPKRAKWHDAYAYGVLVNVYKKGMAAMAAVNRSAVTRKIISFLPTVC